MKVNPKIKIVLLLSLGVFLAFSALYVNNLYTGNSHKILNDNLGTSKISGRIYINNNWTEAKNAGIVTGSGTYSDPYIIEDLIINAEGSEYGIRIENSNVYLKIENCTVYNQISRPCWCRGINGGIVLASVNNTQLINNNCSLNGKGIFLYLSYNNTIYGNTANNNMYYGIILSDSVLNTITENTVNNNEKGIYALWNSYNNIISGNIANNNSESGINIEGSNYTIAGNIMNQSGLSLSIWSSIEDLLSYDIDDTNLVNGKPLNYYKREQNLGSNNFTNAGQVFLVNCSDSIISDLNVSYSTMGISLFFSNNITISGNTANNNIYGINLRNGDNNNITGNTANNNDCGINLWNGDNNNITGNTANDNYQGIRIFGNNNIITGNTANDNYQGIRISSNNNIITGNTVNDSRSGSINIEGVDNTLSGNKMNRWGLNIDWQGDSPEIMSSHDIDDTNLLNGKPIYYYVNENNLGPTNFTNAGQVFLFNCRDSSLINLNISYCTNGITLYFSDHIIISGITANNNSYGIYLRESHSNDIIGNTVNNNDVGIHLMDSEFNDITGNTVNNNNEGIDITFSSANYISGNTANNNQYGIIVDLWSDNIISGNTVNNNQYGIHIYGDYTTVVGNNVSNNEYGIYLRYQCTRTNMISQNMFHNNTLDYFEEKNCWEQGSPSIPGYNLFFLLGILIPVAVIISKKKHKLME